jgi:hypothetical protein
MRVFVETFGVYAHDSLYKLGMMNELFAVPDYEPSMPRAYEEFFRPESSHPWHGRLHVTPEAQPRWGRFVPPERLLDLMSVRWVTVRFPAPPGVVRRLREKTGSGARKLGSALLFTRPGAVPRAYAVRRVRAVPDLEAALAVVAGEAFRPREEAVVTGAGAEPLVDPGEGGWADRVQIASYRPERVALRARCGAPCLVVLTDLHYPGWRATVDGESRPIERTNGIFRGVRVGPGEHTIVYSFAPASFRWGSALALVAVLASLAGLAYSTWWGARGS